MTWQMRIERGSTLRIPLTLKDRTRGFPTSLTSASAQLIPEGGSPAPIDLTIENETLLFPDWTWRGPWSDATSYVLGDVVSYGDFLYRATASNTATPPRDSSVWEGFAQITILIPNTQTETFLWSAGEFRLDVEYSNGDVKQGRMKVPVKVFNA